jgi:hypothetical protein
MSTPSELPDLFGRATVVLGGHEGLRGTVEGLRIRCIAVRSGDAAAVADLRERAGEFCQRVLVHFAAEEGADYFGTLSTESATLAQGIARLKAEHTELTRCIVAIEELARAGRPATVFAEKLEKFLEQLVAHERHETSLLYGYFRPDE